MTDNRPFGRKTDKDVDELEAAKAELKALRDTIVDGLIIIGEDKTILSFNPGAERIFGYTEAEIVGRNVKVLMPTPYHDDHDDYIQNYLSTGEAKIIGIGREVLGRRRDGRVVPLYLSVGEMRGGAGRQFVGVVRDLDDLKEKQELLEGITSNLPGPVFRRIQHTDGTLSFSFVSEGLRKAFDLDPERVRRDSDYLIDAIHADDREGWRAAVRESAASMMPHDYTMRVTGDDGQIRWMQAIARPHRNEGGDIIWDGLALDVSAKLAAEEARDERERQYRDLLHLAPDAIWISDGKHIQYANPAAVAMFGAANAEDLVGRDNLSLVAPDDRDEVLQRRVGLREGMRTAPVEIRRTRFDGAIIETETSAIGVIWDGHPANLIVARDITQRKLGEIRLRQAEKMEAIGQLTGGVAHDFNNLLAVLMMDLEELSGRHKGDDQSEELLQEAREVAQSAAELTSRLLAFSRQQDLQPREIDIPVLISECMSLLRRTIGAHIELDIVRPGELWPVIVDPQQLENALLNLVINARDAMPEGGRITVDSRNTYLDDGYTGNIDWLTAGDYVQIDVTDTGTGIPADVQSKVFDPFFTTKEVGSGTGLGLSMVYGFMKQSGGHVSIYSQEGKGTTISLYLPRALSEDGTQIDAVPQSMLRSAAGETILLVEDFERLRNRASRMLADLGYTVIEAEDGNDAIKKLETSPQIDLLFTDIVMPGGVNGFQLADMARRSKPDLRILFTSGYAEGVEIGGHGSQDTGDRLHKPYSIQDLAKFVRRALDTPRTDGM